MLCRGPLTVTELAERLSLTKNAVRSQLERLQRQKLIRQTGSRQGIRRPHAEYELAAQARRLFPKAYEPALRHLANVLSERAAPETVRELFLETGRRMLAPILDQAKQTDPRRRVAEIVRILNAGAPMVHLSQEPQRLVLRACSCPLASVTASQEGVCDLAAALLGELLGADVRQKCAAGELRQCCFEVDLP
jgi:predicted ArsR family transcriptional regulator